MKYFLTAAALRALSSHALFRKAYRHLGNQRKSRPIVTAKSRWIWQHACRSGIGNSDQTILELGTGWTHANSLYTALLTDVRIEAFDVWDNRSFACVKRHISLVADAISNDSAVSESDKAKAKERAAAALATDSFDRLYKVLNIRYSISSSGIPSCAVSSVDMIYSVDVLEHVSRDDFETLIRVWHKLLKPNAPFVALVGLDDHLSHYDQRRSMKEYVFHSEFIWKHLLNNGLQYINRLTASEILSAFERNGFVIQETEVDRCTVDPSAVHSHYRWQSQEDLEATCLRFRALPLRSN